MIDASYIFENKFSDGELLMQALKHRVEIPLPSHIEKRTLRSKEYRQSVLDFYNNRCFACGYTHFLDIHHIKHKTTGGSDRIDNLVVLCPNHHKEWHYLENNYTTPQKDANTRIKAFDFHEMIWKCFESGIAPMFAMLKYREVMQ